MWLAPSLSNSNSSVPRATFTQRGNLVEIISLRAFRGKNGIDSTPQVYSLVYYEDGLLSAVSHKTVTASTQNDEAESSFLSIDG
ncbi:hypothetical protein ACU8KH_00041 [Lachancea thermotolerans]